jgi:hypothetical protein
MANHGNGRNAGKAVFPEIQVTRKTRSRDGDIVYLDLCAEPGFRYYNWRLSGLKPDAEHIENGPDLWLYSPGSGYKFSRGGAVEVASAISKQFKTAVIDAANKFPWTNARKRRPPEIVIAERAARGLRIQTWFGVKNLAIDCAGGIIFDLTFRSQPTVKISGVFDSVHSGLYPRLVVPWDKLKVAPYRQRGTFEKALLKRLSSFVDFLELHRLRSQRRLPVTASSQLLGALPPSSGIGDTVFQAAPWEFPEQGAA